MDVDPEAEDADRLSLYLASGVVVGDPMSLPDLSPSVDRDVVPLDGVPFDTKRTTGEKVDCALCGRHRNHFKGFVVTFADGRKAIIGINCGEQQLFDKGAWAEMAASAERRKMVALYNARSAPAVAAIDKLLPILDRCGREVAPIDELLSNVASELPDLYRGMSEAAKREGNLTRIVEQKATVIGRDGKQREVTDRRSKIFVALPTVAPFENGGLKGRITKIVRGVERIRSTLDQEGLTLAQQGEAFRALRSFRQDLQYAQSEAEKARRLLSMSFWEAVAKWGQTDYYREGNFRVARSTVRQSDKEYIYGEVRVPPADQYTLEAFVTAREMWPGL